MLWTCLPGLTVYFRPALASLYFAGGGPGIVGIDVPPGIAAPPPAFGGKVPAEGVTALGLMSTVTSPNGGSLTKYSPVKPTEPVTSLSLPTK